MPIKNLTDKVRLPRIGKIHLGIKKKNAQGTEYPSATDYFVFPDKDAPGGQHREELIAAFGEQPKELDIVFPLDEEDIIASQYYKYYTRTRGLVCRGDGETSSRLVDKKTGALPTEKTTDTELREMTCAGKECADYGNCREMMHLQFMLPTVSGLGIWQIDTSSINSIMNVNSNLTMLKQVYGRVSMIPLRLALIKKEVIPGGGTKKKVTVMDIRHTDSLITAIGKSRIAPMELIAGPPDVAQAEKDAVELWGKEVEAEYLDEEETAERMTPEEIKEAEEVPEPPPEATESKSKPVKEETRGSGKKRDPDSLEYITDLQKALSEDFGMEPEEQLKELNIEKWSDLAITPAEAYKQVTSVRNK